MAKRRHVLSVKEMEHMLGFSINENDKVARSLPRFYSDLMPVNAKVQARMEMEMNYYQQHTFSHSSRSLSLIRALDSEDVVIDNGEQYMIVKQQSGSHQYRFLADLKIYPSFELPLLLSEDQISRMRSNVKLKSPLIDAPAGRLDFFGLPSEIRESIYTQLIPVDVWDRAQEDDFLLNNFLGALDDYVGLTAPVLFRAPVLRVCKKMRQEVLPHLYRKTTFFLEDISALIQLLLSIGFIGRQNIESINVIWQDLTEIEANFNDEGQAKDYSLDLPNQHVSRCIALLLKCPRLKTLHLQLDREVIENYTLSAFKMNIGIQRLLELAVTCNVVFHGLGDESITDLEAVQWFLGK